MLKQNTAAPKGEFHARVEQVEKGIWRAVYAGELNPEDPASGQAWPDSHLGDSADSVKTFVENLARQMGYARVVWET